jgi:hypothetical protein
MFSSGPNDEKRRQLMNGNGHTIASSARSKEEKN